MDLQTWLKTPKSQYDEGVRLYKEYNGADKFYNYFNQISGAPPASPHYKMLFHKLSTTLRVALQNNTLKKEGPVIERPKAQQRPEIKVTTILSRKDETETSQNAGDLRQNRLYVNKVLALKWQELDERDKEVFFNNKGYFENKRALFIRNSDNERQLKSMHAALKHQVNKAARATILKDAKTLELQNVANWEVIDRWEIPAPETIIDPVEHARKDAAEKVRKLELLKGYVRRGKLGLKTKADKYSEKVKNNKQKKIDAWKAEIKKIENEIA